MTRTKPRTSRGTRRGRQPQEGRTMTDPADRQRTIREHIARERAKLPVVDNDGHPIEPQPPTPTDPAPRAA